MGGLSSCSRPGRIAETLMVVGSAHCERADHGVGAWDNVSISLSLFEAAEKQ